MNHKEMSTGNVYCMNDSEWVEMHEALGHKVSDTCFRCETCGQSYEEYMSMTKQEKTLFVARYI